jgi:hypothetical protein
VVEPILPGDDVSSLDSSERRLRKDDGVAHETGGQNVALRAEKSTLRDQGGKNQGPKLPNLGVDAADRARAR